MQNFALYLEWITLSPDMNPYDLGQVGTGHLSLD